MKPGGFALVAATFIGVALLSYLLFRSIHWERGGSFPLIAGAVTAIQVGTVLWHREEPAASLKRVQIGLGAVVAITAVVFSLALQAGTGWLKKPEIVIPIAGICCFLFPFVTVKFSWRALSGLPVFEDPEENSAESPESKR